MKRSIMLASALAAVVVANRLPFAGASTLPATVTLTGTIDQTIDSATAAVGMPFTVRLVPPYPAPALEDAVMHGHVVKVQKAGPGTQGIIGLAFDRIVLANGESKTFSGQLLKATYAPDKAETKKKKGLGAVATIVGPAHGIGAHLFLKNDKTNVHIPQNSALIVQLSEPLSL